MKRFFSVIYLFFAIFSFTFSLDKTAVEEKKSAFEQPVVLVKVFGGSPYQVAFPKEPQKKVSGQIVEYSASNQGVVYRIAYYPSWHTFTGALKTPASLPNIPNPFAHNLAEREKIILVENQVFALRMQSGSEQEFAAFCDSFAKIQVLPG
mgnify:CR=1 FL=1